MGENAHSKITNDFFLRVYGSQQKPDTGGSTQQMIAMSSETVSSTNCKENNREFSRLRDLRTLTKWNVQIFAESQCEQTDCKPWANGGNWSTRCVFSTK